MADQPVVLVDGPTLPTASTHGFAALATSILEAGGWAFEHQKNAGGTTKCWNDWNGMGEGERHGFTFQHTPPALQVHRMPAAVCPVDPWRRHWKDMPAGCCRNTARFEAESFTSRDFSFVDCIPTDLIFCFGFWTFFPFNFLSLRWWRKKLDLHTSSNLLEAASRFAKAQLSKFQPEGVNVTDLLIPLSLGNYSSHCGIFIKQPALGVRSDPERPVWICCALWAGKNLWRLHGRFLRRCSFGSHICGVPTLVTRIFQGYSKGYGFREVYRQ